MRKIYLTLAVVTAFIFGAKAQNDTLVWTNFEDTVQYTQMLIEYPSGNDTASFWYNYDADGLPDGSGGSRPNEWFLSYTMTQADSATFNTVMASNSWFTTVAKASNYFITPSFYCSQGVLTWYSAPRQTPRYLDGYKVLISTTTNDLLSFNDTIFHASEYISRNTGDSSAFSSYTFAPANGFIHGADGTYTIMESTDDDAGAKRGLLRKQTVDLSNYEGQNIFIAFWHQSEDDNLISLDEILVKGKMVDNSGLANDKTKEFNFNTYPNPVVDNMQVSFKVDANQSSTLKIYDNAGRMVKMISLGTQTGNQMHNINLADLTSGFYTIALETQAGRAVKKFIKK